MIPALCQQSTSLRRTLVHKNSYELWAASNKLLYFCRQLKMQPAADGSASLTTVPNVQECDARKVQLKNQKPGSTYFFKN